MLTSVILAGGIFIMYQGRPVGYLELSTPHPYSQCREDRERAVWLSKRLSDLLHDEADLSRIEQTLVNDNLARREAYDWCIPSWHLRPTIAYWEKDVNVYAFPLPWLWGRVAVNKAPVKTKVTKRSHYASAAVLPPIRPRGL